MLTATRARQWLPLVRPERAVQFTAPCPCGALVTWEASHVYATGTTTVAPMVHVCREEE